MHTIRSWGQIATVGVAGLIFVALGASGVSAGPAIAEIFNVPVILGGAYFTLSASAAGVWYRKGTLSYRSVAARKTALAPLGVVSIRPRMYLPFVYLQELVVTYPDGTEVALPFASSSSWRSGISQKAFRRQRRLQCWIDRTGMETGASNPEQRGPR